MMLRGRCCLLVVLAAALAEPGAAAERNDLPSCRAHYMREDITAAPPARDLVLIVDRTLALTSAAAASLRQRAVAALQPGDRLVVASFSGLMQDAYTRIDFQAWLDPPLSEDELASKVPARQVRQLQGCATEQLAVAARRLDERLAALLSQPETSAPRSEILAALTAVSRQLIAGSPAATRRVLIVSDMMEHSDRTTFYAARALKPVDAEATMALAHQQQLIGDFGGARVFVAGAAYPGETGAARGLKERQALRAFWQRWIAESSGELAAWGEPDLLVEFR